MVDLFLKKKELDISYREELEIYEEARTELAAKKVELAKARKKQAKDEATLTIIKSQMFINKDKYQDKSSRYHLYLMGMIEERYIQEGMYIHNTRRVV